MSTEGKLKFLGMKNNGLYLNYNKTPLWEISSGLNKKQFFTNYQDLIKELPNQYKNVIFPRDTRNKPNLD